jgi:replicative DNA helicase
MFDLVQGGHPGLRERRGRGRSDGGPPIVSGRAPPHDLDAEAAVLSAILLSREALDQVLDVLRPEHFYSDANGRIYDTAQTLALAGTPIDIVSVGAYLRDRERLAQVGGPAYLAQLADATPAVAHVAAHALVVYEKWRLRALIATCQRVAAEGYGDVGEVQAFIDDAEQNIYALAHTDRRNGARPLGDALRSAFERLVAAASRGDHLTGIPTGFTRLDRKLSGLHAGDLTVVAARPGMGKSAFVGNIAVNVASARRAAIPDPARPSHLIEVDAPGYGVVLFSLEMPSDQLALRMACSEARLEVGRARAGLLRPDEWSRLTEACRYLTHVPIWIDDTAAIGLLELRAKVRRIQADYNRPATAEQPERKVGLVIVDYLQLMAGNPYAANREQQIAEISRGLKRLAKELDVPVVALSQLNRAVETRTVKDKRPMLSDLRESGAVEQDSDNVLFIYRDDYYHPNSDAKGLAEIIIAKQRNGPTGTVMTRFFAGCTRFENLSEGEDPEGEAA